LDALWTLHGAWSWAGEGARTFFFLLGLMFVPPLALAAPLTFGAQAAIARRLDMTRKRLLLAIAGVLAYGLLGAAGYQLATWLIYRGTTDVGPFVSALYMLGTLLVPFSALSVFGVWFPAIVSGAYTTFAKRPRWWVGGLVAFGALALGTAAWVVLGILVGAQTD
jgi:hypothetical protein